MKFILISYHADPEGSNYYQDSSTKLLPELKRLNLEHAVEAIASKGSYARNCRFKPTFIQEHLLRRRGPVLWLDIDSRIHRYPRHILELSGDVDVALASPNGQLHSSKASPIYFNYSPGAFHVLSQWIARIQDHEGQKLATFDHEPLLEVIDELSRTVTVQLLGKEYCSRSPGTDGHSIISMGIASGASKREALKDLNTRETQLLKDKGGLPRLLGSGFPFEIGTSSSGRHKPKFFSWTNRKDDDHMGFRVDMDSAILTGIFDNSVEQKVAWLVESSAIRRDIHEFVMQHSDEIQREYEAFFTCDRGLAYHLKNGVLISSGSNLPWVQPIPPGSVRKHKVCSMFCSSKQITVGHRIRHEVARTFENIIELFGGALGSSRIGCGMFPDKSDGLNNYLFHIVVENAFYDNYFTEKLTDCFVTCTIPVYKGCPSIHEHFNSDGIIHLDPVFDPTCLTESLYLSKWNAVIDNYHRARTLLGADDELFLHVADAF